MTTRIVTYTSSTKVCPDTLPVDVYLCIPPSLIAPTACPNQDPVSETYQLPVIEASLTSISTGSVGCTNSYYTYTFEYDDSQLESYDEGLMITDPELTSGDIESFFIRNCTTDWIEALVGGEVSIDDDGMGNFTLISQHGCEYPFTYSVAIDAQDTNSIDLTFVGPDQLSADLIVDPAANNALTVSGTGVLVPEVTVSDTTTIDLTVAGTPQDISADLIISPDDGNQVQSLLNGVYVNTYAKRWGGTSTGTANAQVIAPPDMPAALADGMMFQFRAGTTNTGAMTLNSGVGGVLDVKTQLGNDTPAGYVTTGYIYTVVYNATLGDYILLDGTPIWQTWTPTYGSLGPMTFTSVTTSFARYLDLDDRVEIQMDFTGTVGGTPAATLTVTTPIVPAQVNIGFSCNALNSGVRQAGTAYVGAVTGTGVIYFKQYAGANWTAGANNGASISGVYEK